MTQQVAIEIPEETTARLVAIPGAVTLPELQLAVHYLTSLWDGTGDVLEIGPLLGSSTRALGMGMLANEKRDPQSQLWTYDWFSFREDNPLDVAPDTFEQLQRAGLITAEDLVYAGVQGTFLPLFEALHRNEDYWPLVHPRVGYLPGHRGEQSAEGEKGLYRGPDREFSVAFVDGCKSWYGTKYWFRETVRHLRPGADLFFQDYGHYTCFWIPMLIAAFRDHFELVAYVDRTYVWRLSEAPTQAQVEWTFADEPTERTRATYDEAFDWLVAGAQERGDRYAAMIHEAQRAAAYAYLGLKDEARKILDGILMLAEWFPLRPYLKQARISPTYTPEGRIEL